jgi:hypothetical protein
MTKDRPNAYCQCCRSTVESVVVVTTLQMPNGTFAESPEEYRERMRQHDYFDVYVGLDRHWYVRGFGYLVYRSDWRVTDV